MCSTCGVPRNFITGIMSIIDRYMDNKKKTSRLVSVQKWLVRFILSVIVLNLLSLLGEKLLNVEMSQVVLGMINIAWVLSCFVLLVILLINRKGFRLPVLLFTVFMTLMFWIAKEAMAFLLILLLLSIKSFFPPAVVYQEADIRIDKPMNALGPCCFYEVYETKSGVFQSKLGNFGGYDIAGPETLKVVKSAEGVEVKICLKNFDSENDSGQNADTVFVFKR